MDHYELYKDIQVRTKGEIYIGVVGPVRTGKSTFIKRFMDVLVLPHLEDENVKARTVDELPQSASGRTIMTTEPKFVPKEAAQVDLTEDVSVKIRLIDCVGYMVEGASGHEEEGQERKVKTPWFDYEIPFTKAAAVGTEKVIHEHSTIGIVVTTDGSIGEIPRSSYEEAEGRTIRELQGIGKPFVVLVNSRRPAGEEAKRVAQHIQETYKVQALPVNCEQLKEEDIHRIMEAVLFEFPVSEIQFFIPRWAEMLPTDHKIRQDLTACVRDLLEQIHQIRDAAHGIETPESPYIEEMRLEKIEMDTGCVKIRMDIGEAFYYEMLSEMTGARINGQYGLICELKKLSAMKNEYECVRGAFDSVRMKGYGVVKPGREEITLDEPEIIRQGNKFGVKIRSHAPTIHLIKANIETEIAPIVGSEQQAEDLIRYIKDRRETEGGIWETNIFGKTVEELVMDGMQSRIAMIGDDSQAKLQDTMQKVVNDINGGMVCIII